MWLPVLCWIKVVRVDILLLLMTLGESSQFFTIKDDVSCEFFLKPFIILWYVWYKPAFLRAFIMNGCSTFSNDLYMYWNDNLVLILSLIDVMYLIIWFVNIEPNFQPRNKSHLIVMKYFLKYHWIWCPSLLLRNFTSIFIRDIGL